MIFQNQDIFTLRPIFFSQFRHSVEDLALQFDDVVVALPGGRSISPFLEELLENFGDIGPEIWRKLHFFVVDERIVGLEENESNFRVLNEIFFQPMMAKGVIRRNQLHPFICNQGDVVSSLEEYHNQLKKLGGVVHLAIVGVGEDGHIGSLFPHHPALKSSNLSFIHIEDSPKPPPNRVTMSPLLLSGAKQVFVLFIGSAKKDALLNYLNPEEDYEHCPAKLFDARHQTQIFTDINIKIHKTIE